MELNLNDLQIDTYRKGPQGWLNKSDTCVRILHIPSGIEIRECDNRSQHWNKAEAVRKLQIVWRMMPELFVPPVSISRSFNAELKTAWDKYRGTKDLEVDEAFSFAAGFIAGRNSK